ncbi:MAG: hypothetical protein D6703_05250 [Zetaproteobacteria bacterium]|nr:MAG: hypothetical protein D6703_05250 [Zetaproteobacteria bacterium]
MKDEERQKKIERVRRTQENIAVFIGVVIALTLSVYFFTYAMLVDKGLTGLLWAQAISAVAMVLILIYLKPISLAITRLWLRRKPAYRPILDDWDKLDAK